MKGDAFGSGFLAAAWLVVLLAALVGIALFWPVAAALVRLPAGNLITLARAAAGIPGVVITGGLVAGILVYQGGLILREVTEIAVSAVYPHTPQTFALVGIVACVLLADRRRLWRAGVLMMAGGGIMLAVVLVVVLMTFPVPFCCAVAFPFHALARLVMGGRFFERVEAIWVFFWVYATACHLAALLLTAAEAWSGAFRMSECRSAIPPLLTLMVTVALFPPDLTQVLRWHESSLPWGLGIAFILPLALTLVAAGRGRLADHGKAPAKSSPGPRTLPERPSTTGRTHLCQSGP